MLLKINDKIEVKVALKIEITLKVHKFMEIQRCKTKRQKKTNLTSILIRGPHHLCDNLILICFTITTS